MKPPVYRAALVLLLAFGGLGTTVSGLLAASLDADATNVAVKPRVVTEKVKHDSDDPAVWVNPSDVAKSLVIGTDKHSDGALYLFNLDGKIVRRVEGLKRPNNVDVAYGLPLGGKATDIAVTAEREVQRLRVFSVPEMSPLDEGGLTVFDGDKKRAPMGIAIYKRPRDGAMFAIVGGKSGPKDGYLWQYRLSDDGKGRVRMTKVREFGTFRGKEEIEAIAVDAALGFVYYSDEGFGVHKYHADPDAPAAAKELAVFGTSGFARDHEGISIYARPDGTGYIVVSNQQANTFRIFPREGSGGNPHAHPLIESVRLSTEESDGNELVVNDFGGRFPGGLFVAMSSNRTFEFYAWRDFGLTKQNGF